MVIFLLRCSSRSAGAQSVLRWVGQNESRCGRHSNSIYTVCNKPQPTYFIYLYLSDECLEAWPFAQNVSRICSFLAAPSSPASHPPFTPLPYMLLLLRPPPSPKAPTFMLRLRRESSAPAEINFMGFMEPMAIALNVSLPRANTTFMFYHTQLRTTPKTLTFSYRRNIFPSYYSGLDILTIRINDFARWAAIETFFRSCAYKSMLTVDTFGLFHFPKYNSPA